MNEQIRGIDHIALQLSSLEEGLAFFHEQLGFKIKFETTFEGHRIVMLQAGKIEIEMWEAQGEKTPHAGQPPIPHGVHHIALEVKKLDEVLAQMKAAGVPITADVYEPTRGIREAMIAGPDGLTLQLVEQNVPLLIWRSLKGEFKQERRA
ncbi:MAG: VOC family protein [Anaerolineae bacterium]|jgi:lactoylglutathione lyase|nr:VOC family protein [Anaerolineae bacterium]